MQTNICNMCRHRVDESGANEDGSIVDAKLMFP